MTNGEHYRLASLDKRLQAHQEAFTLWREMSWSLFGNDDVMRTKVKDCQNWYIRNNLYLTAEAREAFQKAYMAGLHHNDFVNSHKQSSSDETKEMVVNNFIELEAAGKIIEEAVELPSLDLDNELDTNYKEKKKKLFEDM